MFLGCYARRVIAGIAFWTLTPPLENTGDFFVDQLLKLANT
jgi:hypothetical protein